MPIQKRMNILRVPPHQHALDLLFIHNSLQNDLKSIEKKERKM
jgi:hypothetical protein